MLAHCVKLGVEREKVKSGETGTVFKHVELEELLMVSTSVVPPAPIPDESLSMAINCVCPGYGMVKVKESPSWMSYWVSFLVSGVIWPTGTRTSV